MEAFDQKESPEDQAVAYESLSLDLVGHVYHLLLDLWMLLRVSNHLPICILINIEVQLPGLFEFPDQRWIVASIDAVF